MKVLFSFPHPFGLESGIGAVAWHQVHALARHGAEVTVVCTRVDQAPAPELGIRTVSVLGPIRPRMIGRHRALGLVDQVTAWLVRTRRPDIVHTWPKAVLRTAASARRLGIPIVREAPSPYTRVAVQQAADAWADLGLSVPSGHFHHLSEAALAAEDREFAAVDMLLVGAPETQATFAPTPFADRVRVNRYGFDENSIVPLDHVDGAQTVVYVARGEPAKGIHVLLRAWSRADRPSATRLLLRGSMLPEVRRLLAEELAHPSVTEVPRMHDIGGFLTTAQVMVLPSFSEGSALVTYESIGAGLVSLVSAASGAPFEHGVEGLIHATGSENQLQRHLETVLNEPAEFSRLRENAVLLRPRLTWTAAGELLMDSYRELIG